MNDLQKILSRAISDDKYAKTLHDNPEEAMKQAGVEATPEKVAALKSSVASLKGAHAAFGGAVRPD
ncbi:MAG: Os1348 family NHLP clan protein [Bryobacteraceae bacterium]